MSLLFVISLSSCLTTPYNIAVYDPNLPEDQQCTLILASATDEVISFNGKIVNWNKGAGDIFNAYMLLSVIIPSGNHKLVVNHLSSKAQFRNVELEHNFEPNKKYAISRSPLNTFIKIIETK